MTSPAGWYPDPGGTPGMFRFWDGATWSVDLSPSASAPPPGAVGAFGQGYGGQPGAVTGYGPVGNDPASSAYGVSGYEAAPHGSGDPGAVPAGFDPRQPIALDTSPSSVRWTDGAPSAGGASPYAATTSGGNKTGIIIALLVGVVVIALLFWFISSLISNAGGGEDDDNDTPRGNSTTQVCPTQQLAASPIPHTDDGRVHGGLLSYPRLGAPWSAPSYDDRVPFGVDVSTQSIMIHSDFDGFGTSWVASILVSGLYAGDGFYTPQEGSDIVVRCIVNAFYGDAQITREDIRNEATTIDGYDAWIVETNLSFEIEHLPTTSERVTIIVVETSSTVSSLFYASIPGDASQYQADVDATIAALTVGQ
ncbi:MAG: DUF2510 domain-containing protein [Propionibacteriaceae bacterium]|jgi:hypothetical protein|nr:DUF2510 domain-containing protein [Propionibacteriaceae bacterium]